MTQQGIVRSPAPTVPGVDATTDTTMMTRPDLHDELRPPLDDAAAAIEAARCLECGGPSAPAPCTVACPADVDIASFMGSIMHGSMEAAAATVFETNVLSGTCSRVCPVEVLCESQCVLLKEGRRPVQIGQLHRHAADWALTRKRSFRERGPSTGKSVAVLGAGPAGLAAAAELATLGHAVTVYDYRPTSGGLARTAIAPYRIWSDPLPAETALIENLGVSFEYGVDASNADTLADIEEKFDAIFLGIGMGKDTVVDYAGDDLDGVWESLPFIELIKVSLDDGEASLAPSIGTNVAVIGGGNTAIDAARLAVRLGADTVTLVYRRAEEQMPAFAHEVEEAREEGVQFAFLTNPVGFVGDGHVTGIECVKMELVPAEDGGRPRPVAIDGSEFVMPVDTVVKAIGQAPRLDLLELIENLTLDRGLIKIDPATGQTTNDRYFAGGDAVNGGNSVVEAVRMAKVAAQGIHSYLGGTSS